MSMSMYAMYFIESTVRGLQTALHTVSDYSWSNAPNVLLFLLFLFCFLLFLLSFSFFLLFQRGDLFLLAITCVWRLHWSVRRGTWSRVIETGVDFIPLKFCGEPSCLFRRNRDI